MLASSSLTGLDLVQPQHRWFYALNVQPRERATLLLVQVSRFVQHWGESKGPLTCTAAPFVMLKFRSVVMFCVGLRHVSFSSCHRVTSILGSLF